MTIDNGIVSPGNAHDTVGDARRLAAAAWGLDAEATVLGGWEDSNFLLRTSDGRAHVLKISPPEIRRETLENQASMLLHLATGELATMLPRVVPTSDGHAMCPVATPRGTTRWARLLTYLEGRPLVGLDHRPPHLLGEIGHTLARLDVELSTFEHPATRRTHAWDLMTTPNLVRFSRHIEDSGRRRLVESHLDRFAAEVLPRRGELEHGVIHNDANDHNLLVRPSNDGLHLSGIIDFSDLLISPIVADLGISLAYLMLDRNDPLADAAHLIGGYHAVRPLTGLERELLPELVLARVCASLLHAAHGLAREPGNTYLQISAAPMWRLLEWQVAIDDTAFLRTVEAACR